MNNSLRKQFATSTSLEVAQFVYWGNDEHDTCNHEQQVLLELDSIQYSKVGEVNFWHIINSTMNNNKKCLKIPF